MNTGTLFYKTIRWAVAGFALLLAGACTKNFQQYNTNPNGATQQQLQYDNLSTGVFFSQMEQNIFPTAQQPSFGDKMYEEGETLPGDVYSGMMGAGDTCFGGSNNPT